MRILLSDGSGLTARQAATRLSRAGHRVEVLSPDPLCLCRSTRHVRRVHRVPAYGGDPFGWLDAALDVYRARRIDVLLPTQEQVAVLSRCRERLLEAGVRTAVPGFEALRSVQDKVSAFETLTRLGIAQPRSAVARSADDLSAWDAFPVFAKAPIGTATAGVRLANGPAELLAAACELPVLLQEPAEGQLVMAQSVFAEGELVAFHANARVREGARGGASHKLGVDVPALRELVARLGRELEWHGALSADAILSDAGPLVIDVNPRLVEPANAMRSGVDLVGALLAVASRGVPTEARTHQLLLSVLGAAEREGRRRAVAAELLSAALHRGPYRDSDEELTPLRGDPPASLPVAAASIATLVWPEWWRLFASRSVASYALTPRAWDEILRSG
jgi:hypothetical protein